MKLEQIPCPAKINLNLHIVGRREDGYHLLQSYFQLLDLCDFLDIEVTSTSTITISPAIEGVSNQENLIFKAADKLRRYAKKKDLGANITLEKNLPMGGGVGGGSSNAASALLALNQLWGIHLDLDTLCNIGLELGADVPIFIRGQSAWVEGVGEIIEPIHRPEKWYVLVHPDVHISTAEVFQHPQLTRDTPKIKVASVLAGGGRNDCESVVKKLYPQVDYSLQCLNKFAPAKMTGTGACIFAEFEDENQALEAQSRLPDSMRSFVTRGVNRSPLIDFLNQCGVT